MEIIDILPQYDPAYYVSDNHPEDFVALAKQTAQLVESDGQREAHMRELPATPEHECDMPLAALDTKNKVCDQRPCNCKELFLKRKHCRSIKSSWLRYSI